VKGTYWRIDTMPFGRFAEAIDDDNLIGANNNPFFIGISEGQTIERTGASGAVYLNPITYDMDRTLRAAATYIHLKEPMMNAARLFRDKRLKVALDATVGTEYQDIIKKGLMDIAEQTIPPSSLEAAILRRRNKMTTAFIGIPNWLIGPKQLTSILRYSPFADPQNVFEAVIKDITHRKTMRTEVKTYSPEFLQRTRAGPTKAISDIIRSEQPGSEWYRGEATASQKMAHLQRKTVAPSRFFDAESVGIGMYACRLKAVKTLKDGRVFDDLLSATGKTAEQLLSLDAEGQMKAAYQYGDWVTERSQSMSVPEYLSDYQRGSAGLKLFTNFISEPMAVMNMARRAINDAVKKKTVGSAVKAGRVVVMGMVIEPLMQMMIQIGQRALTGKDQTDLGKDILATLLEAPTSGIPIVRDIVRQAVNRAVMGWTGTNNSLTAIDALTDKTVNLIYNLSKAATAESSSQGWNYALKCADGVGEILGLWSGFSYVGARYTAQVGLNLVNKLAGMK
jgi:hypothetical protein